MPTAMDRWLAQVASIAEAIASAFTEILQRVLIIVCDLLLILFAVVAISQDWNCTCDQTLHFYGLMCVMLCVLDLVWETVRCSLEGSLDRLQADFQPETCGSVAHVNANLLGDDVEGVVGQLEEDVPGPSAGRFASTAAGLLGHGIRREKALKRKWTKDLHAWSIVFSCFVSVIFSFFSAHDEDCAERVPHLYNYIHTFTYVFIFRLGAIILWVCCRTIKDYEDAALVAGAESWQNKQLARF